MWYFIMKCGKSRKYIDSDHLGVAKPIRPEDLDRRVTRHGVYPSIPTSQGVPWSTYVRSQRVSSRSISSLGNRTPTTSSVGMIVRPKIRSVSSQGSISSKGKKEGDKAVPSCSPPIIGESAGMFTDMTDTMLKVLDRRAAIAAQACELENTLAENAYALEQNRQRLTGYMPDPVTCHSLSSQPLYVNTMPRTT